MVQEPKWRIAPSTLKPLEYCNIAAFLYVCMTIYCTTTIYYYYTCIRLCRVLLDTHAFPCAEGLTTHPIFIRDISLENRPITTVGSGRCKNDCQWLLPNNPVQQSRVTTKSDCGLLLTCKYATRHKPSEQIPATQKFPTYSK